MGRTLYDCSKENDVKGIEALLTQGADVNEKFTNGETPLLAALSNRRLKAAAITLLLNSNVDVNIADNWGNTPLYRAIDKYDEDPTIIILLLDRGADLNKLHPYQGASLHHAIKQNRADLIHLFLSRGADPNCPDDNGETPLMSMFASYTAMILNSRSKIYNNIPVINDLLNRGADINAQKGKGNATAILYALMNYGVKESTIERLLEHKADVNIPNFWGRVENTLQCRMEDCNDLSDRITGRMLLSLISATSDPDSEKGKLLLSIAPVLELCRFNNRFISTFIDATGLPKELYDMIIVELVALTFPEISLAQKLNYLEAYANSIAVVVDETCKFRA